MVTRLPDQQASTYAIRSGFTNRRIVLSILTVFSVRVSRKTTRNKQAALSAPAEIRVSGDYSEESVAASARTT
jgi:hypothetical protein